MSNEEPHDVYDEIAAEVDVDEAAEGFARLSPAARRFMSGDMSDDEARRLGFVRDHPGDGASGPLS
jgi:hypothetical protein